MRDKIKIVKVIPQGTDGKLTFILLVVDKTLTVDVCKEVCLPYSSKSGRTINVFSLTRSLHTLTFPMDKYFWKAPFPKPAALFLGI